MTRQHARYFGAVLSARTAYRFGPVWLLGSIVLPTFLILLISRRPNPHTIGLQLVIGVCLGLLAAALLFARGGRADTFALFWQFFVHWLARRQTGTTPPWVFQSPGGPLMGSAVVGRCWPLGSISVAVSHLALPTVAVRGLVCLRASASLSARFLPAERRTGGTTLLSTLPARQRAGPGLSGRLLSVLLLAGALTPVSLFCLGDLGSDRHPSLSAYHACSRRLKGQDLSCVVANGAILDASCRPASP